MKQLSFKNVFIQTQSLSCIGDVSLIGNEIRAYLSISTGYIAGAPYTGTDIIINGTTMHLEPFEGARMLNGKDYLLETKPYKRIQCSDIVPMGDPGLDIITQQAIHRYSHLVR